MIGRTTIYLLWRFTNGMKRVGIILSTLFILSGCTSPVAEDVEIIQSDNVEELQGVNVVAKTLGREIDVTADYNLLERSGNNSTLILWAAAGCNGCHLWTEMIRQCMLRFTDIPGSRSFSMYTTPTVITHQNTTARGQFWYPQRQTLRGMPQLESKARFPYQKLSTIRSRLHYK